MVYIMATKFTNINNDKEHYGVRVCDDRGHSTYDSDLFMGPEDIPSDLEILEELTATPVNDAMESMMNSVRKEGQVVINGNYYDDL